jgi:hypothetical protein
MMQDLSVVVDRIHSFCGPDLEFTHITDSCAHGTARWEVLSQEVGGAKCSLMPVNNQGIAGLMFTCWIMPLAPVHSRRLIDATIDLLNKELNRLNATLIIDPDIGYLLATLWFESSKPLTYVELGELVNINKVLGFATRDALKAVHQRQTEPGQAFLDFCRADFRRVS